MIYNEPPYPFLVIAEKQDDGHRYACCICCGPRDSCWWHSHAIHLAKIVPGHESMSFRQPQSERMGDFPLAVIELSRLHAPDESTPPNDWIALHHASSIQTLEFIECDSGSYRWKWLVVPTSEPTSPAVVNVRIRLAIPFVSMLPRVIDSDAHSASGDRDLPHKSCSNSLQLPVGSFLPLRASYGTNSTTAVIRISSWNSTNEASGVLHLLIQSGLLRDGTVFSKEVAVVTEVEGTKSCSV